MFLIYCRSIALLILILLIIILRISFLLIVIILVFYNLIISMRIYTDSFGVAIVISILVLILIHIIDFITALFAATIINLTATMVAILLFFFDTQKFIVHSVVVYPAVGVIVPINVVVLVLAHFDSVSPSLLFLFAGLILLLHIASIYLVEELFKLFFIKFATTAAALSSIRGLIVIG